MMKLSIVMPVYVLDEELYMLTGNTLQSLANSYEWQDIELIIVDNASKIGSDQLLMNCDTYIRNKVNLGYPKAVNQGIKLAKGELICVSNNDIRVSPNWIKVTQEVFEKLPKTGSLHFKMVEYNAPFNLGEGVWDKGRELWCHGSFFVWRREAIEAIQGLDEGYGLGGYDDYSWQLRMREKGWVTAYTNAAAFQHKDSTTQLKLDQTERSERDKKNYEYFKSKHGEYPDVLWKKLYPEQFRRGWLPFP